MCILGNEVRMVIDYIIRFCEWACQKTLILYSSLAQSVERMTVNHDVAGSSPAGGANAPLAQLVEQLTLNQWVPGSNP